MPTAFLPNPVTATHSPLTFEIAFNSPTANAWAHSFLRTLHAALVSEFPQQAKGLVLRVARTAQLHFNQHPHTITGREACIAVGVCGLLVASYSVLGQHLFDGKRAMALTEHSLVASYRAFVERVCVPLVHRGAACAPDLKRLNFASWSAHLYPGISSADGSGYAAFFRSYGVDELTAMLRSIDIAWQRAAAELSSGPIYASDYYDSGFSPFRFAVQTPHTLLKPPRVMRLVVPGH